MKLRVIAGTLGGRQFDAPGGYRTHPMSEQIRGALFNILGDVHDLTLLDAFAGSGAIAYEAISRGAQKVVAIEVDRQAHNVITRNLQRLGLTSKAIRANASGWSDNNLDDRFDIVVCDPPYDDLQLPLIQKLTKHLQDDSTLVLSWPGAKAVPELTGLKAVKQKSYGDDQLVFYKKTG